MGCFGYFWILESLKFVAIVLKVKGKEEIFLSPETGKIK